ncbi:hypothetical protein ACPPVO_45265 [Dactylosporangium sp. McL0621]|uniref:hypothetical protein n=1 Tax=Dactylosporangium sp. McL0621 TaxID=3415678 RepID=UPI003CE838A9
MSLDPAVFEARAAAWGDWHASIATRLEAVEARLPGLEAAWQGPAGRTHHALIQARLDVLRQERDTAFQRKLAQEAAGQEIRRARKMVARALPDGPPPAGLRHPRHGNLAGAVFALAEACSTLSAELRQTPAWNAAEAAARKERRAARPRRPRPPLQPRRPGDLLGRRPDAAERATSPEPPIAPERTLLGRRAAQLRHPDGHQVAGPNHLLGHRRRPATEQKPARTDGLARLRGGREILAPPPEAPPEPAETAPAISDRPRPPSPPAEPEPAGEAGPEVAPPVPGNRLVRPFGVVLGAPEAGDARTAPAAVAIESTDDAAAGLLLRDLAASLRGDDARSAPDRPPARLTVAAAMRVLTDDSGRRPAEPGPLAGRRVVACLSPSHLDPSRLGEALADALTDATNHVLDGTGHGHERFWLAANCRDYTAGVVHRQLVRGTRRRSARMGLVVALASLATLHPAPVVLGLTGTALGLTGLSIAYHRRRPVRRHLPAELLDGPAAVTARPIAIGPVTLGGISVDRVADDRGALKVLERVIGGGAQVVILVEAMHRWTPPVRQRLWELLRFARDEHRAALRIVVSYDPELLAAAYDDRSEDRGAGWSAVDRMALLSIPVPEAPPARPARPAAPPMPAVSADVAGERLRVRAARAGVSRRQAGKLLATWQFYLRVGPGEPVAAQLGVLAEIMVRWPALRSRLVAVVNGRHGLCWLADAAGDDRLWDEALHALDLNAAPFRECRTQLRALLRSPDAEGLAGVVDWGVFG